jgi:hypothetical protein
MRVPYFEPDAGIAMRGICPARKPPKSEDARSPESQLRRDGERSHLRSPI